jgi:hypothetical protein
MEMATLAYLYLVDSAAADSISQRVTSEHAIRRLYGWKHCATFRRLRRMLGQGV